MNGRSHAIAIPLLLVATTLAASGPAAAIYMITPLTLTATPAEANVGDVVTFQLAANPDDEGPSYAGATVNVQYSFDPQEGQHAPSSGDDPDQPVSSEDRPDSEPSYTFVDLPDVTLDDTENATFTWTVPAEVDDRNVFVTVLSDAGETLASTHVRVGDAEPIMMIAASGPAENRVEETPGADGTTQTPPDASPTAGAPTPDESGDADAADDARSNVPAPGIVGALVAAAIAVALVARRR